MNVYKNGVSTITATEKAYNFIYKGQGYKPLNEKNTEQCKPKRNPIKSKSKVV